jgi:chromosome segregation ATPase
LTQSINLLIDPRVAADGITVADLQEQFEHNMRMRDLVSGVNQLVTRVREAVNKSPNDTRLIALAAKLLTEPVRYGKPGLQAHITYLASMTANVDQKVGRDAIERYQVLKKEFDRLRAEAEQLLGATDDADKDPDFYR